MSHTRKTPLTWNGESALTFRLEDGKPFAVLMLGLDPLDTAAVFEAYGRLRPHEGSQVEPTISVAQDARVPLRLILIDESRLTSLQDRDAPWARGLRGRSLPPQWVPVLKHRHRKVECEQLPAQGCPFYLHSPLDASVLMPLLASVGLDVEPEPQPAVVRPPAQGLRQMAQALIQLPSMATSVAARPAPRTARSGARA